MIPDINTQLLAVIKSLKDTVAPAVDPQNRLAQEQLHLALGTLNIVREHLPQLHAYQRTDIAEQLAMSRELIGASKDFDQQDINSLIENSEQALADPGIGSEALQRIARQLRAGIGRLISAQIDNAALDKIVLKYSERALNRGRAWNLAMGFEPDPAAVPELSSLLD